MDKIQLRKAVATDLEQLLAFEQGIIETERPFDPTLKREHTNYYDLPKMIGATDVEVVVAEVAGKIVASGYARIERSKDYNQHRQHAYLGFMYVSPAYRGRGINKLVMDHLAAWASSKNITELRLDVYYQNESAIKAYEKVGFTKHMILMRRTTQQ